MAIHITDPLFDELVERAQKVLKTASKEATIQQALEKVVAEEPVIVSEPAAKVDERPLEERLKALQDHLKAIGKPNPDFDDKAFLDEMCGN